MNNTELTAKQGRKRWSADEKNKYVQAWQKSGLSCSKFCHQEGLPIKNFYFWAKKFKKKNSALSFLPVSMPSSKKEEQQSLEIIFPNGLICRLPQIANVSAISQIVKELHYDFSHPK